MKSKPAGHKARVLTLFLVFFRVWRRVFLFVFCCAPSVFPCMAPFSHLASVSSCFLAVRANCIFSRTSTSGVISLLFYGSYQQNAFFYDMPGLICITNIGSHN